MTRTNIPYVDRVWNPIIGCDDPKFNPALLNEPSRWKAPNAVMVCSTTDMFHESVPCEIIEQIIATMKANPKHSFLVLTKRAHNLSLYHFPTNVMVGVSIENRDNMSRLEALHEVDCYHKWISFEPLIGDVGPMNLDDIDFVVVGGETGKNKKLRSCNGIWVRDIYLQCKAKSVPYYFKQYGTYFVADGVDMGSAAFHQKDLPIIDNPPF